VIVLDTNVVSELMRAAPDESVRDWQIAAIAKSTGAADATRDAAGYDGCGVDVINPWSG